MYKDDKIINHLYHFFAEISSTPEDSFPYFLQLFPDLIYQKVSLAKKTFKLTEKSLMEIVNFECVH
jgi:hypothetical protein